MDLLRRSAALIAAYAVALQLVLSAFAAVAPLAAGLALRSAAATVDGPPAIRPTILALPASRIAPARRLPAATRSR